MEEGIEIFLDKGCYIESLSRARRNLAGQLLSKLDEVIDVELDLALMGAAKAKSEILKKSKDSVVKPIK